MQQKLKTPTDDKFDDSKIEETTKLLDEVEDEDVFVKEEVTKNLDATQLYLGEIGFSPLLSAEEEVFLHENRLKAAKPPENV